MDVLLAITWRLQVDLLNDGPVTILVDSKIRE